jgi:hypothetical protein
MPVAAEELAVIALTTVGVPGWTMPNVAILDVFGLNDAVIARNPVAAERFRLMAHDRSAPPGYIECFRPNVEMQPNGTPLIRARAVPLTSADVQACEGDFFALVTQRPPSPLTPEASLAPPQLLTASEFEALQNAPEVLHLETFDVPNASLSFSGFAFGEGPTQSALPLQQPIVGASGSYLNSYHRGDLSTGMVSLPLPKGTRRVALKVAGSASCDTVFAGVAEGQRLLARACGERTEALKAVLFTLPPGRELRFVAFDASTEGWGHLLVDDVLALP